MKYDDDIIKKITFEPKDLDKKIGEMIYVPQHENIIDETKSASQLWFKTKDCDYLINEWTWHTVKFDAGLKPE